MTVGLLSFVKSGDPAFSQRSIINMDFTFNNQMAFIDHLKQAINWLGPFGLGYSTGSTANSFYNSNLIDSNGWPKTLPNGNAGGGFSFPGSTEFAGPYIIDGSGEGNFSLSTPVAQDTWTVNSKTSNVTVNSNGNFSVTDSGSGWSINVTYSGQGSFTPPFFQPLQIQIITTDPNNTGKYIGYGGLTGRPTLRIYRQADQADLNAGKIYRSAFKQLLVDNNPSAIRFMNWVGGNIGSGDSTTSWRYRSTPNLAGATPSLNFLASPPYTSASASGNNDYTLASATGMPVAYAHGELINFRCDTTNVRCATPGFPTAITKQSPTGVATLAGHGLQTGDKLLWRVASGMTGLDYCVSTVGATTTNTFEIGLDTSSQPTWVAAGNNGFAAMMTMNVGARGAIPVFAPDGQQSALNFGANFQAGNYYHLTFDKYLGYRTSPGASITTGAWLAHVLSGSSSSPFSAGTPIELCVALVNEVNAMYTTQAATHAWFNMPATGVLSVDPDATSADNWPVNAVTAAINGGTYSGVTYPGLTSKANIFLEFSNETWNTAGEAFGQSFYLDRCSAIRSALSRPGAYCSFHTLRSSVMVQDVKAAFPGSSRIKFVMGAQAASLALSNGFNYQRVNGNQVIALDPWNTWGNVWQGTGHISGTTFTVDTTTSGAVQVGQKLFGTGIFVGDIQGPVTTILSGSGSTWTIDRNLGTVATEAMQASLAPMAIHDAVCFATYVGASSAWDTSNLATCQAAWKANGKPASDPNIDTYLAGFITDLGSQSIAFFQTVIDSFSAVVAPYPGTKFIGYEGQWDNNVSVGTGGTIGTITQDQADFLIACKHSDTWKNAWLGLLDAYGAAGNGAMPGLFTMAGGRWGFIDPYTGSTYVGTTEDAAFDQVFLAMGARNRLLR